MSGTRGCQGEEAPLGRILSTCTLPALVPLCHTVYVGQGCTCTHGHLGW